MKIALLFAILIQSLAVFGDEPLVFETKSTTSIFAYSGGATRKSQKLRVMLGKDQTEAFEVARFCQPLSQYENLTFIKQLPAVTQVSYVPNEKCPCDEKVISLLNECPGISTLTLTSSYRSTRNEQDYTLSHVDWSALANSAHLEKLGLGISGKLQLAGSKFAECAGPQLNGLVFQLYAEASIDEENLKLLAACPWLKSLEINAYRSDSQAALELLKRCTTALPKHCKIQLNLK